MARSEQEQQRGGDEEESCAPHQPMDEDATHGRDEDQEAYDHDADAALGARLLTDDVLDLGLGAVACAHEHDQRQAGAYEAEEQKEPDDGLADEASDRAQR
jgi:hypothetical protein